MWFLYLESLQGYLLHPLKINYDQLYNAVLIVENFEIFFFFFILCRGMYNSFWQILLFKNKQTNKQDIDGRCLLFHLLLESSCTARIPHNFTFELDLSVLDLYEEYIFNNSLKLLGLTIALLMIPYTKLSDFQLSLSYIVQ